VGCEEFKKESDLIEKEGVLVCPDHLKKPDLIKEENRFFRLSAYTEKLKEYFKNNTHLIRPEYRGNEIKQYLES
jgi:methionyl-tRNA synthetase